MVVNTADLRAFDNDLRLHRQPFYVRRSRIYDITDSKDRVEIVTVVAELLLMQQQQRYPILLDGSIKS